MKIVDNSELFRHQCEVRYLIKMWRLKGDAWLMDYLGKDVVSHRVKTLKEDIKCQWAKDKEMGNG